MNEDHLPLRRRQTKSAPHEHVTNVDDLRSPVQLVVLAAIAPPEVQTCAVRVAVVGFPCGATLLFRQE